MISIPIVAVQTCEAVREGSFRWAIKLTSPPLTGAAAALLAPPANTAPTSKGKETKGALAEGKGKERESDGWIASVTYILHPTFTKNRVRRSLSPYKIERVGWGTFEVGIEILDRFGKRHLLRHELSFSSKVTRSNHVLMIEVPEPSPLERMDVDVEGDEETANYDEGEDDDDDEDADTATTSTASTAATKSTTESIASNAKTDNTAKTKQNDKTERETGKKPTTTTTATATGATPATEGVATTTTSRGSRPAPGSSSFVERMGSEVSPSAMHGFLGEGRGWEAPIVTARCDEEARPGYKSMKAHEYTEEPRVLREKVALLASLIRASPAVVAYTGAGISTGAGIGDYATKAASSAVQRPRISSGFDAQPTLGHHTLAQLHHAGLLHHWVQQNHDGLPQKAGFPPEHLNEIHGSWYDPSNPVVPMSGTLRSDLCEWMYEWERKADLTLAIGTSLCGMNADRMVESVARRSKKGKATGAVIISLQQTQYDDVACLRIFARIDDTLSLLAREMELTLPTRRIDYTPAVPKAHIRAPHVFSVPYDRHGKLVTGAGAARTEWNLTEGARIRVVSGPGKGFIGKVLGRTSPEGHYRISLPTIREGDKNHGKGSHVYILGCWWVQTAVNGSAETLPIVNC